MKDRAVSLIMIDSNPKEFLKLKWIIDTDINNKKSAFENMSKNNYRTVGVDGCCTPDRLIHGVAQLLHLAG